MNRRFALIILALLTTATLRAEDSGIPFEDLRDGPAIAAELRSLMPTSDSEWTGELRIRGSDRSVVTVPVRSRVEAGQGCWRTVYWTGPVDGHPAEVLTVEKRADGPNRYHHARATAGGLAPGNPQPVDGAAINTPLAGSDFSLGDLGQEFLHWPAQERLRGELSRGRSCHVLESRHPDPMTNGYSRVVSWIDKDTGGLLQAKAYDAEDRLVKEFSIGSVRKVDGVWQLQEMEIRNRLTGTRTRLEFELKRS